MVTSILAIFLSICLVLVSARERQKPPKECVELNQAYADLIYRIWIDNPDYVLDVVCETDEFCRIDELLNGDLKCIFTYRCIEDSIRQAGAPDPGCAPALHDRPLNPVEQIRFPCKKTN